MDTAPTTTLRPVLSDTLPLERLVASAWARTAVLVLAGALVSAATAQIRIPLGFTPVPITAGTFGVLVAAAALGPWRGAASQALYVAFGMLGLPYFAGGPEGGSGLEVVFSTSGGYFAGYIIVGFVVGALARRGWDRGFLSAAGVVGLGSAIILATGTLWLGLVQQLGPVEAFTQGALPFLIGDALKTLAAAGVLPLAWRLIGESRESE